MIQRVKNKPTDNRIGHRIRRGGEHDEVADVIERHDDDHEAANHVDALDTIRTRIGSHTEGCNGSRYAGSKRTPAYKPSQRSAFFTCPGGYSGLVQLLRLVVMPARPRHGKREDLGRQARKEIVVARHVEHVTAIGKVGPPGEPFDLFGDHVRMVRRVDLVGDRAVDEQGLGDRQTIEPGQPPVDWPVLIRRSDRACRVDLVDPLQVRCLRRYVRGRRHQGPVVALEHEELMIVDSQDSFTPRP